MGCVFGKEASSSSGVVSASEARKEDKRSKSLRIESDRKVGEAAVVVESSNGTRVTDNGNQEGNQDGDEKERKERRRKPSVGRNLSKHLRGEQVAAGWPAWLSAVAGEAINGWLPRRADSFEKIDKVCITLILSISFIYFYCVLHCCICRGNLVNSAFIHAMQLKLVYIF